jgi:hypothetical protein
MRLNIVSDTLNLPSQLRSNYRQDLEGGRGLGRICRGPGGMEQDSTLHYLDRRVKSWMFKLLESYIKSTTFEMLEAGCHSSLPNSLIGC